MSEPVKKRGYVSPTRRAKAVETRERILAAASERFLEAGYARTSTASIAKAAGTSEANVFAVFGSKADLLFQVVDFHIRADPGFSMGELSKWQGLIGEEHRTAAVAELARIVRGVLDRTWRVRAVTDDAALTDDAVRTIAERGARARHRSASWFVREVLRLPPERQEETADAVWALIHVQNYRLLVLDRGWSAGHYEVWLAQMLAAVIDDQAGRGAADATRRGGR